MSSWPPGGAEIDWGNVQRSLRRQFIRRAGTGDREYIDDLVQEGSIRLLRAVRRGPVDRMDGLVATIAHRTWVDFIRRRARCRKLFSTGAKTEATVGPEAFAWGDPAERLRFVVLELFEREGSTSCLELARAHFAGKDWKMVATALDRSHDAVRKAWSRCVEAARRIIKEDPALSRLFEPVENA